MYSGCGDSIFENSRKMRRELQNVKYRLVNLQIAVEQSLDILIDGKPPVTSGRRDIYPEELRIKEAVNRLRFQNSLSR